MLWVNVMVSSWACAVKGDRPVVVTVVFNDCRSVTIEANAWGGVFVRSWRHLKFLGVPNDDGFIVNNGSNNRRCRKNAWCWGKELCNFAE